MIIEWKEVREIAIQIPGERKLLEREQKAQRHLGVVGKLGWQLLLKMKLEK